MMQIVLVTGAREFTDKWLLWALLDNIVQQMARDKDPGPLIIMHGAAKFGADNHAHHWVRERGPFWASANTPVEVYEQADPALWHVNERTAGHARNQRQADRLREYRLDQTPWRVIVCHNLPTLKDVQELEHGGTKSQVDKLVKAGFDTRDMTYLKGRS